MTDDRNLESPCITVLMPLKNYHLQFLKRSIASVQGQSSPLWRLLIIVEKQDLDSFGKILREELLDSRITIIQNEGRKLSGAFNTGMRHAQTTFVAILLADDMWSSDAVQTLSDYILRFETVDFFHSSRIVIDEKDRFISPVMPSKKRFRIADFGASSPVKHLLCWRREKALSFGGMDESLNSVGPDDFDFPWTMAEQGAIFMAVKECLYQYRSHFQCFRLTTHLPLDVHIGELRRIMTKHGLKEPDIRENHRSR